MASSSTIQVRKVTDVHANFSVQGEYQPGKFSLQLILDNGAVEEVVMPTAQDTKVLIKLLGGDTVYFDTERKALVFSNV